MADHDPLFKTLFQFFFADLFRIVAPEIAPELDLEQAKFLREEFFTDAPRAERRQADLLASVPWLTQDREDLLAHIEIQARALRATGERVWRYSMHIGLRHRRTPLSLLVNLRGGKPGVRKETLRKGEPGLRLVAFTYLVFDLGPSPAQEFLARSEPLAWALAALMRPGNWGRARLKLECLRKIAGSDLDEARKGLLTNCVHTYLELVGSDEKEYRKMLAEETNRDVTEWEMTWADKLIAKGREQGWEEGLTQASEG